MVEMGLVPFTSSKQYDVACLEDICFDPKTKSIVWNTEKNLKIGTHPPITTVTEKTVVRNVEEDQNDWLPWALQMHMKILIVLITS